jgi:hypothetical protein
MEDGQNADACAKALRVGLRLLSMISDEALDSRP